MRVLIVEDEVLAAGRLEGMLLNLDPAIEITGKLESVLDSINWLHSNQHPDLIFMDVQLDDGICFEIFDSINVTTPIIFTTAYDRYAIRAFQVNSIDYLLKPVEEALLAKALKKYRSIVDTRPAASSGINVLSGTVIKSYKARFFVKVGNHFYSIPVKDIDCFFIAERASLFKTNSGKIYNADYSLDQVQKLVDPEKFFRINRNHIVNIDAIQDIYNYSSSRLGINIKMMDRLNLIVSREKVNDFKKWLDR